MSKQVDERRMRSIDVVSYIREIRDIGKVADAMMSERHRADENEDAERDMSVMLSSVQPRANVSCFKRTDPCLQLRPPLASVSNLSLRNPHLPQQQLALAPALA